MDQAKFAVNRYLDASSIYNRKSVALDVAVEAFARCTQDKIQGQVVVITNGATWVQWTAEEGIRRL